MKMTTAARLALYVQSRASTDIGAPVLNTRRLISGVPEYDIHIKQLRAEEREVFLLRQNGDMTYDEIAESLELPTGTVKTRMRLALNKLREVLKES